MWAESFLRFVFGSHSLSPFQSARPVCLLNLFSVLSTAFKGFDAYALKHTLTNQMYLFEIA